MRDNAIVINAFLLIILASAFLSIISSSSSSSSCCCCCIDRARVGHIGHPNIAEIRFKVDAASHYNLQRAMCWSLRAGFGVAADLAAARRHAVGKAVGKRLARSSGPAAHETRAAAAEAAMNVRREQRDGLGYYHCLDPASNTKQSS